MNVLTVIQSKTPESHKPSRVHSSPWAELHDCFSHTLTTGVPQRIQLTPVSSFNGAFFWSVFVCVVALCLGSGLVSLQGTSIQACVNLALRVRVVICDFLTYQTKWHTAQPAVNIWTWTLSLRQRGGFTLGHRHDTKFYVFLVRIFHSYHLIYRPKEKSVEYDTLCP